MEFNRLLKYLTGKDDHGVVSQLEADLASDEKRSEKLKEADELMKQMEFQNRSQHQISKEFPNYSKYYGNRSIYDKGYSDLEKFNQDKTVKNAVDKSLNKENKTHVEKVNDVLNVKSVSQDLATKALIEDVLKSNPDKIQVEDLLNKLKNKDNIDYGYMGNSDDSNLNGAYYPDLNFVTLAVDNPNIKGTALHEHLHALLTKRGITPGLMSSEAYQSGDDKTIKDIRKQSSGHFGYVPIDEQSGRLQNYMDKDYKLPEYTYGTKSSFVIPEIYVQDSVENIMRDKGFKVGEDPIKDNFEKLKNLMRYKK